MKPPGTLAKVNAALKKAGYKERLTRGRGYYYFRGGDAVLWFTSSVCVSSADSFTVDEWIQQYKDLKNA